MSRGGPKDTRDGERGPDRVRSGGSHGVSGGGAGVSAETKNPSSSSVLDRDVSQTHKAGPVGSLGGPDLPGEVTALSHFYRGELQRSNTWRLRLDATTNWAILITGGLLSFGFNYPERFPLVLTLNSIILLFFLLIEARRYRYYDVWRSRVRVLEVNFLLPFVTDQLCQQRSGWREELGTDLLVPRFKIGLLEAFARRFRRNYVWIYLLLLFGWLADLAMALEEGLSVRDFVSRAEIGTIPGWLVLVAQAVYLTALAGIALFTVRRRKASGQVYESRDALCSFQDDTHF